MANGQKRSREEREQWVARWKASGMSVAKFAAEHGLAVSTLHQRRLRAAVHRIAEQDSRLGRHLELSVKTGLFCMYAPTWPD